jgi:hypothetical protein
VKDNLLEGTTTFANEIISENGDEEIRVEVTEGCRLSFALHYLKAYAAAATLSKRVTLFFSPNFPLLVSFDANTMAVISMKRSETTSSKKYDDSAPC